MNPYLSRLMIRDEDRFYGRHRQVARILDRVASDRPQSVSVVGERRIGKSSLLYYLTWPGVREKLVDNPGSLVVAFLDFQQLRTISLQDFFELLFYQIGRADPSLGGAEAPTYGSFHKMLERLSKENRKLIMLFDEFDAITSNPTFDRDFFSYLRSTANNYDVGYVTSSKTELQQLCHSSEISDSPFFNIFTNLYLGPLAHEEALELIASPSAAEKIPLEEFSEDILDLAGYLPFYLQIACSVYFDWLRENPGRHLDSEEIEARIREEADPHFSHFWQQCPSEQQQVLVAVMEGRMPSPEHAHIARRLLKAGYLRETEEKQLRVFSKLLTQFAGAAESRTIGATVAESGTAPASSTEVDLSPGARINQYEVVSRAGKGGMGVVYRALDLVLQRPVALKVIRPDLLDKATFRDRFVREARSAAGLAHPSITAVYELLELGSQVVLVMEWLEGRTLAEEIAARGRLDWREMVNWLIEIGNGLETAHGNGIVHRDIKPANLMITAGRHMKILDFGLAKQRESRMKTLQTLTLTNAGDFLGTLAYMSPEQVRGESADGRSDIFSAGVVLFEGITGKIPFLRRTPAATIDAILNDPTPELGFYQVGNDEPLNRILGMMLEKEPLERYANVGELLSDLADLLKPRKKLFFWRGP